MNVVNTFITKVEEKVPIEQRVPLMDVAMQSTSARWWVNHRNSLSKWEDFAIALRARFKEDAGPQFIEKYQGDFDPTNHLENCEYNWKKPGYPKSLWMHNFIHSLDTILEAWYLTEEKKRGTGT